ncbi:hypothetical protein TUE45_01539 [Streptomyces reticuli]|nr:hypothetical protein TUE45_01539 [Streptomyces reticuli]
MSQAGHRPDRAGPHTAPSPAVATEAPALHRTHTELDPLPFATPARAGTPPGRRAYCLELVPWAPRACASCALSDRLARPQRRGCPPAAFPRPADWSRPASAQGTARRCPAPGRRHAQPGARSGRQRPGRRRVGARLPALRRAGRTKAAGTYAERAGAAGRRPGSACHRGPRGGEPLRTGRTGEALHLLERCAHLTAGSRPPVAELDARAWRCSRHPHRCPTPSVRSRLVNSWLSLSGPLSPGDFVAQSQWSALAW